MKKKKTCGYKIDVQSILLMVRFNVMVFTVRKSSSSSAFSGKMHANIQAKVTQSLILELCGPQ